MSRASLSESGAKVKGGAFKNLSVEAADTQIDDGAEMTGQFHADAQFAAVV